MSSPTAPSVVGSAQADTASTAPRDGASLTSSAVRAANPDKNTVDFSGVSWEWNAARTHLEPDSFPDARVDARSNVWRRDNGTGLIRIFSDVDLSGMNFRTAGGSWPLSQRRSGLFVSNISAEDVEQIRVGGGSGGRQTPIRCWPSQVVGGGVRVPALNALHTMIVGVTCDRNIVDSDHGETINSAATPTSLPDWILADYIRFDRKEPVFRSVEVELRIYPENNTGAERSGGMRWASSAPPGTQGISLMVVTITQEAEREAQQGDSIVDLICLDSRTSGPKRPIDCPTHVEVGSTLSLGATVTPTPDGYAREKQNGRQNGKIECGVGQETMTCGWRISQGAGSGSFESGDSTNLTWRAPFSPGRVTISARYEVYEERHRDPDNFTNYIPEGWSRSKRNSSSNTLTFTVFEPVAATPLDLDLMCGETPPTAGGACDFVLGETTSMHVTLKVYIDGTSTPATSADMATPEWSKSGGSIAVDSDSMGVMWTPTGLSSGDEARVTVSVNTATQNADPRVGFANTATMVVRDPYLPPVVSAAICTTQVTPQGGNPECTATLDDPDGRGHIVNLGVTASDPNGDDLEYVWRTEHGSLTPRGDQAIWSAAGLTSDRTYTVTVSVNDRFFNVSESFQIKVVRYEPPGEDERSETYVCAPDAGWKTRGGEPVVGDPYCGQLHSRSHTWTGFTTHTDYVWRSAVGSVGSPEVELENSRWRPAIGIHTENVNRICGIARGVCGESNSLYDSTVHDEGGNIYQWVYIYPVD